MKIDAIAQIMDNSPRLTWKVGVIEELITGNSGQTSAARIRTTSELIATRPIVKLVPLEI